MISSLRGIRTHPSDNKSKHGAGVEEAESLMDSYSSPNAKEGIVSKLNSFFITLKDVLLFALLVGILVLVATLQINTAKAAVTGGYTPAGALPGCNCGASIKQALELDCKYDSLASAWLPPHCRDDELTAMFDRAGPGVNGSWKYWADEDFTREISLQDVSRLADVPGSLYYTSHRWHVIHCLFYWRKQVRAPRLGITVEPRYSHERHVTHCMEILDEDSTSGTDTQSGIALNSNY
ncbi:hypothetical protein MY4824_009535 [Beauveria thailandica]